jgi:hypothetical protein
MRDPISIRRLRAVIRTLPNDRRVIDPNKWYRSQKEHWLGWLGEYAGSGAYGRKGGVGRDARFAYNHIVEPAMLLYLARAAGVARTRLAAARRDAAAGRTLMEQSAAIRKIIPWEVVAAKLWADYEHSLR